MARKVFGEIISTGTVEVWVSGPVSPAVLECLESFISHKRKQHAEMNPADLVEQEFHSAGQSSTGNPHN
jgi:hypothetical protein